MRKYILSSMALAIFFISAFQQKNSIAELSEKIINRLNLYIEEMPEEKVFLHFDKEYYASGEDIWFSVYVTAGSPDVFSPLSKVVYVDLLDNEGLLINQKTIKVEEGTGHGDFKLNTFMAEGIYHIKAYTAWIKGFGEEFVFSKSLQIMDSQKSDFQPQVNFELEAEGDKLLYTAQITAVNSVLKPMADQNINYEVLSKNQKLKQGKLTLDGQGNHELVFELKEADLIENIVLRLVYEENEEYKISRNFQLPFPQSVIDLQFLPEGGDLVEGFANKVAFRAVFPDGSPAKVKGKIVSQGYEQVFETNKNGLGSLSITPTASQKLTAYIEDGLRKIETSFPEAKPTGINLTVDNQNPQLLSLLVQSGNYATIDPSMEGLIVVHARGRIGYMQKLDFQNGVTGARVNKNTLAPGINQLTIFSSTGVPLAERLIYIDFTETPQLVISSTETDFKSRGKNKVKINVEAENFNGGKYSISITDASNPSFGGGTNILTYLKFSSELKGRIIDSDIFSNGKVDAEAVELIMLTHGWKRFNWEKVMESTYENTKYIEQGINIMGLVKPKYKSKRGLDGGVLNVFTLGEDNEEGFLVSEFNENGKFMLDNLDIRDTTTLVLVAKDRKQNNKVDIELENPISLYQQWDGFEPLLSSHVISSEFRDFLLNAEKRRRSDIAFADPEAYDLEEFVVSQKQIIDEKDGITRAYGEGNRSFRPNDIAGSESYSNIFSMIQGRIPGVQVNANPIAPSITIRGSGSFAEVPPLFLLDNVPVDISVINTVNPRDVEVIEAFTDGASNAIFGSSGAGGVLAIYTKRGQSVYSPEEGVLHAKYAGYSTAREYYMPKYSEEATAKPDYRNTLYWNPNLVLSEQAEIEFYNNDISDKFKVVVQGIDNNGRISYAEQLIN